MKTFIMMEKPEKRNSGKFLATTAAAALAALGLTFGARASNWAGPPTVLPPAQVTAPAPFTSNPITSNPNIFADLAKKVVPGVVNISVRGKPRIMRPAMGYSDPFQFFWGIQPPGMQPRREGPRPMSLGTGFVIDSEGLILTNHHVIAEADQISVQFTEDPSEKPTEAEVVGMDPELDVALLQAKGRRGLPVLELGDSDALQVGEYVMAVGNPFGQGHSVTHGIISAKGRVAPDFPLAQYIQTDTPINPGNSGGPLVNLRGEVIAINDAIDARAQGIGFAIPSNLVKAILPQLKSNGRVSRGYIGVLIDQLNPRVAEKVGADPELKAPIITHVYNGSPAAEAGIQPYDVITEFDGKAVSSASDLVAAVTRSEAGKKIPVQVLRSGKKVKVSIEIGKRPGRSEETVSS